MTKQVMVQVTLEVTFDFEADYEDNVEVDPRSREQRELVKFQVGQWMETDYSGFWYSFKPDIYVNIPGAIHD